MSASISDPTVIKGAVPSRSGRRPKTISGKIRRVALRDREAAIHADPSAAPAGEFTL